MSRTVLVCCARSGWRALGLSRVTLGCLSLVIVLGAALRLAELGNWPAFVDEDMYTTVAVEMTHLGWPDFILHSTDASATGIAKTPLLFVGQAALIDLGLDPLVAGRLLSALCGVLAIPFVFLLGRRLSGGDVQAGLLSAGVYAVLPMAVFHERLVLQDGPMSAALLAAVVVAWHANRRGSGSLYLVAGALAALAVQAKVSAIFGVIVLLRIALIGWREASPRQRLAGLIPPACGALSYVVLSLAPTGPGLAAQNAILSGATPSAMLANATTLADGLLTYFPFGSWLLLPVGFVVLARRDAPSCMLVLWALIALTVPWLVLSRGSPMRYYLAAMPYLCCLVALGLVAGSRLVAQALKRIPRVAPSGVPARGAIQSRLTSRPAPIALVPPIALLLGLLTVSSRFVLDSDGAVLSSADDWAYRSGWPSGVMYAAARQFIGGVAAPDSSVAYVVDDQHRTAMGLYRRGPDGVQVGEPLLLDPRIAPILQAAKYVVVDDTRYDQPGERLAEVRALAPELVEIARFADPGSAAAVTVLARGAVQARPRPRTQ